MSADYIFRMVPLEKEKKSKEENNQKAHAGLVKAGA